MVGHVLVVDDDEERSAVLRACITSPGRSVVTTSSPEEALALVRGQDFDAIMIDVGVRPVSCVALCERLHGIRPDIPLILLTGFDGVEMAMAAMRAGACDVLTKPADARLVDESITTAMRSRALRDQLSRPRERVVDPSPIDSLIGDSAPMQRVRDLIMRIADSDASILIQGETGTGKELVARAIHAMGPRKNGPFVAINCAAMPAGLLESELFGHTRGAYTDAKTSRAGLFVQATGGTLFLDEIGEMPIDMQAKLLRALQQRVVRPVGGEHEVPFDARILASTHRDLESQSDGLSFRRDLYYRINVVRIDVPPLRERGRDVLTLAPYFLDRFCVRAKRPRMELPVRVAERLLEYDWPGNVRELENCLDHAVALARFQHLTLEDLPEKVRSHRADGFAPSTNRDDEVVSLDEVERRHILSVLKRVAGNKSRAAHLLGLDRRTLYRKLERYASDLGPDHGAGQGSALDGSP